jgi:hypothetical protein
MHFPICLLELFDGAQIRPYRPVLWAAMLTFTGDGL